MLLVGQKFMCKSKNQTRSVHNPPRAPVLVTSCLGCTVVGCSGTLATVLVLCCPLDTRAVNYTHDGCTNATHTSVRVTPSGTVHYATAQGSSSMVHAGGSAVQVGFLRRNIMPCSCWRSAELLPLRDVGAWRQANDGAWHRISLTHYWANGEDRRIAPGSVHCWTGHARWHRDASSALGRGGAGAGAGTTNLWLDGRRIAQVQERVRPTRFVLGAVRRWVAQRHPMATGQAGRQCHCHGRVMNRTHAGSPRGVRLSTHSSRAD